MKLEPPRDILRALEWHLEDLALLVESAKSAVTGTIRAAIAPRYVYNAFTQLQNAKAGSLLTMTCYLG